MHESNKFKLMLEIGMPGVERTAAAQEEPEGPTVEERVKDALDLIDSGHESPVEWRMISRLYNSLCALAKPSKRAINLIETMEPILAKYGHLGKAPETDAS